MCEITIQTRKKCKKCRITKCFKSGMRKDWIMTEGEREEKRRKIEENRRRKLTNGSSIDCLNSDSSQNHLYEDSPLANDNSPNANAIGYPIRRRRRRKRNGDQQPQQQTSPQSTNKNNVSSIQTTQANSNKQQSSKSLEKASKATRQTFNSPVQKSNVKSSEINNEHIQPNQYSASKSNLYQAPITVSVDSSLTKSSASPAARSSHVNSLLGAHQSNSFSPMSASATVQPPVLYSKTSASEQSQLFDGTSVLAKSNLREITSAVLFGQLSHNSLHQMQAPPTNSSNLPPPLLNNNYKQNQANAASLANQTRFSDTARQATRSSSTTSSQLASKHYDKSEPSMIMYDDRDRYQRRLEYECDEPDIKVVEKETHNPTVNDYPEEEGPYEHLKHKFYDKKTDIADYIHDYSGRYKKNAIIKQDTDYSMLLNNNRLNSASMSSLPQDHTMKSRSESPVDNSNSTIILDDNCIVGKETEIRSPSTSSQCSSADSSCSSSTAGAMATPDHSRIVSLEHPLAPARAMHLLSYQNSIESESIEAQVLMIRRAYTSAMQLVKAKGMPKMSEDINTTINITELPVRRIINFFKLIIDFRNLEHDLKLKILKHSMMDLLQINGANSYNKENETFQEPDTDDTPFSAKSLKTVYGDKIYELTVSLLNNLYDLCEGDQVYIKLFMLVVLFDPKNEALNKNDQKLIDNLHKKYLNLTFYYLCHVFGAERGENKFISFTKELKNANELSRYFSIAILKESNSEYLRPLMKEVFCLHSDAVNEAQDTTITESDSVNLRSNAPDTKSDYSISQAKRLNLAAPVQSAETIANLNELKAEPKLNPNSDELNYDFDVQQTTPKSIDS
jgi:hypothetical protein